MSRMCVSDLEKKHKTTDRKQNNTYQFKKLNKKRSRFNFLTNRAIRHRAGLVVMIKAIGG